MLAVKGGKRGVPVTLFGAQMDDRSLFVTLTVAGYTATPCNLVRDMVCPRCTIGNVWAVAVVRRGVAAHAFDVCRECGHAIHTYDSTGGRVR